MATFIATTDDETFTGTDGVTDTVDYSLTPDSTGGIVVAYAATGAEVTGGSGTDALTSIENIIGTAFSDLVLVDNSAITGSYKLTLGEGNDIFSVNQSSGTWDVDGGHGFDQFSGTMIDTGTGYNLVYNGDTGFGSVGNITIHGMESVKLTLSTADDTATLRGGKDNFISSAGGSDAITVNSFHGLNNIFDGGTMPVSGTSTIDADTDTFTLDLSTTTGVHDLLVSFNTSGEFFALDAYGTNSHVNANHFEAVNLTLNGDDNVISVNDADTDDGRSLHIDAGAGSDTFTFQAAQGQSVNLDMSGGVTHSSNIGQYDNFESAILYLTDSIDTVTLGDGDDRIYGGAVASTISGGGGDDIIISDGNLFGGAGNDTLQAPEGDNTLSGGTGDDILKGGSGSNTYLFALGDGHDQIADYNRGETTAVNRIVFAAGINPGDVTLGRDTSTFDLVLSVGNGGDTIRVLQYFHNLGQIQQVVFADGTIWTAATLDAAPPVASEGSDGLYYGAGDQTVHALGGNDAVAGGDGDDQLYGDDGNDGLDGGNGDDYLDGGAGIDYMSGDGGDDTYIVDNALDRVSEFAEFNRDPGGNDVVYSSISFYIPNNVETLILTGTADLNGGSTATTAVTITGNSGNNILHGNTAIDTLQGGAGNDVYVVFNSQTVVTENANEGTDKVLSSVDFTLSANVENLTITGTAVKATGNGLNNIIVGDVQNNWIDGGTGADHMFGGAGNDTYIVDNDGDRVSEELSGHDDGGNDTVMSSVTFHIFSYVENLTLTGTGDINATGNQWNNVLTGNDGKNVLNGQIGADTMSGGKGDDGYIVDNVNDVVIENANEGTDKILSNVSYTLSANVENLTLSGAGNINATGNGMDNLIVGNTGNNHLDGGAGTDRLWGGAGADTFVFSAGSGADIIKDFSVSDNDHIDLSAYTHGTADAGMVHDYFGSTLIDMGGGNTVIVANATSSDVLSHIVW